MAAQLLHTAKYLLTSKKIFQGSILTDFLLQNNLSPRVYGYMSTTSEKKFLKPLSPAENNPKGKHQHSPQTEQCDSLIIKIFRRLKLLLALWKQNLSGNVVLQHSPQDFLLLCWIRVTVTRFLTFYERLTETEDLRIYSSSWLCFFKQQSYIW